MDLNHLFITFLLYKSSNFVLPKYTMKLIFFDGAVEIVRFRKLIIL